MKHLNLFSISFLLSGIILYTSACGTGTMSIPPQGSAETAMETLMTPAAVDSVEAASAAEKTSVSPESLIPSASEQKLIRTVYLTFESSDYDGFQKHLQSCMAAHHAYAESYEYTGQSQSHSKLRYASYLLRIPEEYLTSFLTEIEQEGTLLERRESTQDISLNYYDLESRKKVLYTEQDRLLTLLSEAENIEALIALEERLSEIRYEAESLESRLRSYDNSIQYASVYLSVSETEIEHAGNDSSLLQKIQTGFHQNLLTVRNLFLGFVVGFITILPSLLALTLLFMLVYRIWKSFRVHLSAKQINQKQPKSSETSSAGKQKSGNEIDYESEQ